MRIKYISKKEKSERNKPIREKFNFIISVILENKLIISSINNISCENSKL